ncbi:MAG: EFR1 family ferrodoxin [Candidatus Izemoplasmatales bacterium]
MKRAICFFSGTGNAYYVASKIHSRFPDTSLFFIPSIDSKSLAIFDEIGIVTPVYGFGLPKIVRKFIEGMTFVGNPRIYAIFVCGGGPGISSDLTVQALKKNAKVLAYHDYVIMPDNFILMYKVNESHNQLMLQAAEIKIDTILTNLEQQMTLKYCPHIFGFLKWFQKLAARFFNSTSKHYVVTGCIGCMKCVKLCPVENIIFKEKTVVFGNCCTDCLGCINICPIQAINYRRITQKKGRYFNPFVDYQAIKDCSK